MALDFRGPNFKRLPGANYRSECRLTPATSTVATRNDRFTARHPSSASRKQRPLADDGKSVKSTLADRRGQQHEDGLWPKVGQVGAQAVVERRRHCTAADFDLRRSPRCSCAEDKRIVITFADRDARVGWGQTRILVISEPVPLCSIVIHPQ